MDIGWAVEVRQDVTVTGAVDPAGPVGPRLDLTLRFGPSRVVTSPDCTFSTHQSWLRELRGFLDGRPPLTIHVDSWQGGGEYATVPVELEGSEDLDYSFTIGPSH